MKKTIKMRFVDWYLQDNEENFYSHYLIKILQERYDIVYSDEPDYIIYSVFEFNRHTNYDCIRILFTEENRRTNWNIADYGIDFDYMNFSDRHIRVPFQFLWLQDDMNIAQKKHVCYTGSNYKKRDKFCAYLITDPGRPEWTPRDKFIDLLSMYKRIDSGGRYRNNIGGPIGNRYGEDFNITKRKWLQDYKFNICFENSSAPGYTSEKLFQAFSAGCIPIYWGDTSLRCGLGLEEKISCNSEIDQRIPKIPEDLLEYKINPKAFINAHNFSTWSELVEEIKRIDQNDDLYLEMLKEPIFLSDFDAVEYSKKKIFDFFDNIFNQNLECALRRGEGAHISFELRDKKKCSADYNNELKPKGAVHRVQNQLAYRLGYAVVENGKNIFKIWFLPLILLGIFLSYRQEKRIYNKNIQKNPALKLPPLEFYEDYSKALKYKEHLSYKIGQEILQCLKHWYKGRIFLLPIRIIKIYKNYKGKKC
ncbi:glycosyltransferase family 10 [Campylobacter lari]